MRNARGFSLVELIVAMTVTLIVSSAIYGLLTAGGNAFRREPELADRQQNIRAAMDLVARDVYSAGASLPPFAQVFTRSDPGGACAGSLNGCGAPGPLGPVPAAARGGDSENLDVLQMVSTDEQCPYLAVCSTGAANPIPGTGGVFVTQLAAPACMNVPGLLVLTADNAFTVAAATALGGAASCTTPGAPVNANFTLTASLAPWAAVGFDPAGNPEPGQVNSVYLFRGRVIRYRVAPNLDPLDPMPSLWRTETGLYQTDGTAALEPTDGGFNAGNTQWQLVARGIEDLQVEYVDGNGAWLNQPPIATQDVWTSLVRGVRITLSARVSQANLAGESAAAGGAPQAVRGQLSAVITPRAAFHHLQMCRTAAPVPCTPAEQIQ